MLRFALELRGSKGPTRGEILIGQTGGEVIIWSYYHIEALRWSQELMC